ncbi:hypothetical protein [Geminisphaera colitermitum]|nr:hypothetical protein [Geminisphaera colitermitum]
MSLPGKLLYHLWHRPHLLTGHRFWYQTAFCLWLRALARSKH